MTLSKFAVPVKLHTVREDEVSLGVRARGLASPRGEATPISTTRGGGTELHLP